MRLSAALSYYSVFSIAPLLLIAISLAGAIFGKDAAQGKIASELGQFIGAEAANRCKPWCRARARRVAPDAGGFRHSVYRRLDGFRPVEGGPEYHLECPAEVQPWNFRLYQGASDELWHGAGHRLFAAGFLAHDDRAGGDKRRDEADSTCPNRRGEHARLCRVARGGEPAFWPALQGAARRQNRLADGLAGAVATAVLFEIGKSLLGWYLGQASTTSSFGAAGSIVVLLLWVFYASCILFLGAEFTKVYAREVGCEIEPSDMAEFVTKPSATSARVACRRILSPPRRASQPCR